jgi:hypothetical protein
MAAVLAAGARDPAPEYGINHLADPVCPCAFRCGSR